MTKPTRDECLQWLDMSGQWIASMGKQREDDLIMLLAIRDMLAAPSVPNKAPDEYDAPDDGTERRMDY